MESLWSEQEASVWVGDPTQMRVYTPRLLEKETSQDLQGGGNTSVKATAVNIFCENEGVLYFNGS